MQNRGRPTALRRLTGNTALDVGDLLEVADVPLHGDPDRPAFDAAHLKTFEFRPRKDRPVSQRPSEDIVIELRDRQ
ncbi:hypothetical protein [Deinococcus xinjiangensis]|uniref:hypothetical protein n=1 Tax=Deinococcus xinjiangensis TaxID=457454 RepID=UPI003365483B